ncbi:MAG: glycosyltransferase [Vicinamibacterales bacterium]
MRILIVQRSLAPPGGGNAVAAWMVDALCGHHDVGTLTESEWPVATTNEFYGTSIAAAAIRRHVVPAPWQWLSGLREDRLTRLRMCAVLRDARSRASQYDLMITADNFAAFPTPGIQYVHFPARVQPEPVRLDALVRVYFTLCDWVSGSPSTDAARNITLANSRWTAERLSALGEVSTPIVLYPPVRDAGEGLPWPDRDDTFLCIGRFDVSKRIEVSIAIVKAARARALPDARLIIVGSAVDSGYYSRLRAVADREGHWIEFREDLSRLELDTLIRRSRYGIQAMRGEHFGMATAEMTRAGCLVFAHDSGGSPEVLDHQRALLWPTEEDAVVKIAAMASGSPSPERLSARLREHARKFSAELFGEQLRKLVTHAHVS